MRMSSRGPVAIVTGAAQGIGFSISDCLMKEGYRVCLADVNVAKGKESVTELLKKHGAGRAIFADCNVTSKESFDATFTKTKQEFGSVDVLVNNAGILDEDHPDRTVSINLMGTIIGCQLALRYMGTSNGGQGGSVVNVSSVLGFVPHPKAPIYSATKHAIIGLTRSYGHPVHFDQSGVIFTAMCPYYVITPLLQNTKLLEGDDRKMLESNSKMLKIVGIFALCFLAFAWADDEREPSDCELDRARRLNATDNDSILHLVPICEENGDYAAKQCFTNIDWCVCYRRNGENIGSPSKSIKDCKCVRARDDVRQSGNTDQFLPLCAKDGYYRPKQCFKKECWCVDQNGDVTTEPTLDDVQC